MEHKNEFMWPLRSCFILWGGECVFIMLASIKELSKFVDKWMGSKEFRFQIVMWLSMSLIKLCSSHNILGFKMLQNDYTIAIIDLL